MISAVAKEGDPRGATAYIKKPADVDQIVKTAAENCQPFGDSSGPVQ